MQRGLSSELRRLFLFLLIALLVGLATGHMTLVLLASTLGYIGWSLWQMRRVENWLAHRGLDNAPDCDGIWEEVVHQVLLQQERHNKERRRLQGLITRVQETTAAQKDAVVLLDNNTTIQWWNQSAYRLLGLRAEDNGKPIFNYIRSPKFVRYLEEGQFQEPLLLAASADADLFLNYQVSRFGQGEYLLVVRDVSRLHKLEIMRKDFIGNVSHELRTPLTVIRGYLETMSDNSDTLPAVWKKALLQMEAQTKRMTLLIEDLLTLTKLETEDTDYKQTEVNIPELLAAIRVDAISLSGDKEHKVELDIVDDVTLLGVREELRSCFSNLAFNAIRYSPAGSLVILRCYRKEDEAVVEVQDHGIGIEARHLPRLTERFYRVDASRSLDTGGTGLGLAIVKHVLSRHHGQLNIRSRVNHGSTFACSFAASRVIEPAPAQPVEEQAQ
ncbi:phosphate regulon sensor histidine kinase PhoR [Halioxenophilus sp. WMMB6]|uniref:phosphate regulon sensor histidine kinase PhoR n=1 Tax=Halioxenophilus sp. WMMB6 TaxID=3073815 RepID=UPI00295EF4AB|nr:phosphate regulon sensor histidine kinase PhoR [Halioxenophilus sp. WMMB6]